METPQWPPLPPMRCPTPTYLETSELNVKGIHLLQEGNNVDAITCFSKGLRVMHACLRTSQPPRQDVSTMCDATAFICCESWDCLKFGVPEEGRRGLLFSVALEQQEDDALNVAHHDDIFAIYSRALHLSIDRIPLEGIPVTYGYLLAGVFLYNAGLAHHLEALQKVDTSMLTRALDLYTMAHHMLTTESTKLPEKDSMSQTMMALAIANNCGHVHAYFRELEKTRLCGRLLCSHLSHPSFGNCDLLRDEQFKTFILNMTFMTEGTLIATPAA